MAIKHNVKKQPLAQESPNGILDNGGRRKKNHSVLALFVIYYQHPLLETHSQELDGLRRPDLSVFPKAKLNRDRKILKKFQSLAFTKGIIKMQHNYKKKKKRLNI